jgi:hypothetical protein
MMMPPVLITSSVITMDASGVLNNPDLRIQYTLESISAWLKIKPGIQLVICDGSGYDFAPSIQTHFPSAQIECLALQNNPDKVKKHGKGYGEGEIIRYALTHSRLLQRADAFIKCTAKLWILNIDDCMKQWNGQFACNAYFANVFSLKKTQLQFIDTRFYISTKAFYSHYFSEAHMDLGDTAGRSIEDTFLEVIRQHHLKHILFGVPPIVCGVGGGSGKYYKSGRMRILKDRLRMQIAQKNTTYTDLFIKWSGSLKLKRGSQ